MPGRRISEFEDHEEGVSLKILGTAASLVWPKKTDPAVRQ